MRREMMPDDQWLDWMDPDRSCPRSTPISWANAPLSSVWIVQCKVAAQMISCFPSSLAIAVTDNNEPSNAESFKLVLSAVSTRCQSSPALTTSSFPDEATDTISCSLTGELLSIRMPDCLRPDRKNEARVSPAEPVVSRGTFNATFPGHALTAAS